MLIVVCVALRVQGSGGAVRCGQSLAGTSCEHFTVGLLLLNHSCSTTLTSARQMSNFFTSGFVYFRYIYIERERDKNEPKNDLEVLIH